MATVPFCQAMSLALLREIQHSTGQHVACAPKPIVAAWKALRREKILGRGVERLKDRVNSMRIRHRDKVIFSVATGAILLTIVGACVVASWLGVTPNSAAFSQNAGLSGVGLQPTNPPQYGAQNGPLNAILTSPDNVRLQIVAVQRGSTRWLFHIHAHNNTIQRVIIWGNGSDHYFMLSGATTPGTPVTASQMFLPLTAPTQVDLAAHSALPSIVNGDGDVDGWLVADFSHFTYPTDGFLYYVYGTVTTTACANLTDRSTCHPSTGYRTLVWRLS